MTTHVQEDDLLGTFAVIEPEKWESIEAELWELPFANLWIDYERILSEIKDLEWQLGCPDNHMLPEDIPQNLAKWDEFRQMLPLYEDILVQRGWDRISTPADEELPQCCICKYRMHHWDKREDMCDECEYEMWRDMAREEGRDW